MIDVAKKDQVQLTVELSSLCWSPLLVCVCDSAAEDKHQAGHGWLVSTYSAAPKWCGANVCSMLPEMARHAVGYALRLGLVGVDIRVWVQV